QHTSIGSEKKAGDGCKPFAGPASCINQRMLVAAQNEFVSRERNKNAARERDENPGAERHRRLPLEYSKHIQEACGTSEIRNQQCGANCGADKPHQKKSANQDNIAVEKLGSKGHTSRYTRDSA